MPPVMGARSGQNYINYFSETELIKLFVQLILWCNCFYSPNYFYVFYNVIWDLLRNSGTGKIIDERNEKI